MTVVDRSTNAGNESEKNEKLENKQEQKVFPMIAIGGSAGSIAAFEQFFVHMPMHSGAVFVVALHFSENHDTALPEIIGRNTQMQVSLLTDNLKLVPENVYIIPPGKEAVVQDGEIRLIKNVKTHPKFCIDTFFKSIAHIYKEKAVGIIFSGMGTDGTEGLKAIKANHGLALVQEPKSTTYDGMPKSAIATGVVDAVLPVEDLPDQVIHYLNNNYTAKPFENISAQDQNSSAQQKILNHILVKTGHDFSFYKTNTILRRIERRMNYHHFTDKAQYARYLDQNPSEIDILFNEMLIGVTNFFRDPEAFEIMKEKIIPQLLEGKPEGEIRMWVPACSTGEEAYSLAMVLIEVLEKLDRKEKYKIQLFGTDIDHIAISKARLGLYPESIREHVSDERLERFFLRKDNKYQIKKEIREMMVFAPQSLIKDPPFTKLDILSCRNFLIYLTPELQKKLISLFHYSLNGNGILFLGSSETLSGFGDLFAPLSTKYRIFSKIDSHTVFTGMMDFPLAYIKASRYNENSDKDKASKGRVIPSKVQKVLLENYAPPSLVINGVGDILYINGAAGKYLELPPGQATMSVERVAREGLKFDLMHSIREVKSLSRSVTRKNLWVKLDSGYIIINLTVRPFEEVKDLQGLLLISFEEVGRPVGHENIERNEEISDEQSRKIVAELEKELKYTKLHLQSTIQEMEASLEELTSTNEEIQSTNEELQSANEELTTSKEEMQSLNEELVTVNSELNSKMDQYSQVNNDIKNLLETTDIITIFLDNQLNIKRFTPQAKRIFKLIQVDIGRPITDIVSKLDYTDLVKDIEEVMETLIFKKKEVHTFEDDYFEMKIFPYRTTDNYIGGVVVTFYETTSLRKLSSDLENLRVITDKMMDTAREGIAVIGTDFRFYNVNPIFYEHLKLKEKNLIGKSWTEVAEKKWGTNPFEELFNRILPQKKEVENYPLEHAALGKLLINARYVEEKGFFIITTEEVKQ